MAVSTHGRNDDLAGVDNSAQGDFSQTSSPARVCGGQINQVLLERLLHGQTSQNTAFSVILVNSASSEVR
jgi:hypothetical protein